ncbi:MAG: hypothetical protein OJF51_000126 [Nitrospira sp.]|jgi:hypothetical protein|nr:MAG: hypothetical protein OJF51_000126 [Nitrospira sp.]
MERMIMLDVPEDQTLLAAFGELTLRHEHLNHALRMTIKTLANLEVNEALDATAYEGASNLRGRIRKLAKQRLGEGQVLLKLEAIIERCRRATEKRNSYVHSVVGKELDGDACQKSEDHRWQPLPTSRDLKRLSDDILCLTKELNDARLEGYLSEALLKRPL